MTTTTTTYIKISNTVRVPLISSTLIITDQVNEWLELGRKGAGDLARDDLAAWAATLDARCETLRSLGRECWTPELADDLEPIVVIADVLDRDAMSLARRGRYVGVGLWVVDRSAARSLYFDHVVWPEAGRVELTTLLSTREGR